MPRTSRPTPSRSVSGCLPSALRSPDQAETFAGKSVLCFPPVASPGAELHRKEEGG